MKLTICILVTLNVILSFLQAQPPQHGGQGQHPQQGQHHRPPVPPLFMLLDKNHDGALSAEEIEAGMKLIKDADRNGDGQVSLMELLPRPPQGQGGHQGGRHGAPNGGPNGQQDQAQQAPIPRDYYRD